MTFNEFQSEVYEWSFANFGDQSSLKPLLGVFEEIGEYYEAETIEDKDDAVADAMIYIADFTARRGIDLGLVVSRIDALGPMSSSRSRERCCIIDEGKLCHSVLKLEQGIRGNEDHGDVMCDALARIIEWCRWSGGGGPIELFLTRIVLPVWADVKLRDWSKNKVDGVQ